MKNKKVLPKILRRCRKFIPVFVMIMALSALYAALSLYIPLLFGNIIDLLIGKDGVDFDAMLPLLVKIAVCAAAAAVVQWFTGVLNNRASFKIVSGLRSDMFKKIQRLPMSYLDTHQTGDIISRFTNDAEQFGDGLLMGFTQLFSGVALIIGTLIFMLTIKPSVTAVVVLLTPLSLLTARFIAKRTFGMFAKRSKDNGAQTAFITETVAEQKTVRALGAERDSERRFEEYNGAVYQSSLKSTFFSSLVNPSTRFINALVYAAVAFTGALTIISDPAAMTVGALSSFLAYANKYTKPFNEISGVIAELQSALACAERIFEFTGQKEETEETENRLPEDKTVQIENMSFSYVPDKPLIQNMNFTAKPGKHTAIVGPTGCGKTTLINLLMRFYDVTDGQIKLGGVDIRKMKRSALRSSYGMVLQETWLRYGTIADNISIGRPDSTRAEIEEAAKAAHAHSFILKLKDGYDTLIGEDGGELSQGQKQLLCIARVMLCRPEMLILDEATSSIDTMTEKKIQEAFDSMTDGKTAFIVAHRLSTVLNADEILVMRSGHIVESGSHTELMNKKGFYYELYQSQFKQGKEI